MIPFGPDGLSARASPQLSRYAIASINVAGKPLAPEAARKIGFSFGSEVIRFAPGRARGSRRMLKVCDSIIRLARAARSSSEISSRPAPIPETRCEGVK
jgi:hypothetical protein